MPPPFHLGITGTLESRNLLTQSQNHLFLDSISPLTSIQVHSDALVSSFVSHATDGYSLAAMVAGSLVYRLTRVGTLALGSRLLSSSVSPLPSHFFRLTSTGISFTGEVFAFEAGQRALRVGIGGADPNLLRWSGENGLGRGLVGAAITLGSLKGAGVFARVQNPLLQHLFQDTAMVLAHNIADFSGVSVRTRHLSMVEQFIEAEATLWQMNAGMALVHGTLPRLGQMERGLDLAVRVHISPHPPLTLQPLLAPAVTLPTRNHPIRDSLSLSNPLTPPRDSRVSKETQSYLHLFGNNPERRTEKIIRVALASRCEDPHFHERLIEGYATTPGATTRARYVTALALKNLFSFDAIQQPTGSLENMLLQRLFREVIADSNPSRRRTSLQAIFQAMEDPLGLSRRKIVELLQAHTSLTFPSSTDLLYSAEFYHRHISEVIEAWKDYSTDHQIQWFNVIDALAGGNPSLASHMIRLIGQGYRSGRYAPELIDAVLEYARRHPFGGLILERALQVFAVEDAPAKLKELTDSAELDEIVETFTLIVRMHQRGVDPERIAASLIGTRHTAYLSDARVARKVVFTALSVYPFVEGVMDPPPLRRFQQALTRFLETRSLLELTTQDLVNLLQASDYPFFTSLSRRLREKELILDLVPEDEMRQKDPQGTLPSANFALYVPASASQPKHTLFITEAPRLPLRSAEERQVAHSHIIARLLALVHEHEHYIHHTGNYEGGESGAEPLSIANTSRPQRLASEMMAYLEEERWRILHVDLSTVEIAQRLGQNLPLHLRNLADGGYHAQVNSQLMRKFLEGD